MAVGPTCQNSLFSHPPLSLPSPLSQSRRPSSEHLWPFAAPTTGLAASPTAARYADGYLLELDVLWSSSTSASPAIGLGILAALPEDEGKKKKHVAVRALREVEEGVD